MPNATRIPGAESEEDKEICAQVVFKAQAPLKPYLIKKHPTEGVDTQEVLTLRTILDLVLRIINDEGLFDQGNPYIIICDAELETALDMKALHIIELRDQVAKQLEAPQEPGILIRISKAASEAAASLGTLVREAQTASKKANVTPQSTGITPQTPNLEAQTSRDGEESEDEAPKPIPLPRFKIRHKDPPIARVTPYQPPTQPRPRELKVNIPWLRRDTLQSHKTKGTAPTEGPGWVVPLDMQVKIDPDLLRIFRSLEGVQGDKTVFTYVEVTKMMSRYILNNKYRFFDDRNIKVVMLQGDPLGDCFGLKCFHRIQISNLLRSKLTFLGRASVAVRTHQIMH